MRVIGGEFRSRILKSIPGLDTRPTPDRLREALFNVLAPRIEGAVFADLYAGTGAVGIEALSRGAVRAIFVEKSRAALQVIRENLRSLGVEARADVRQGSPSKLVGILKADIVFLDPPYQAEKEYAATMMALAEHAPPLVIAQHPQRLQLEEHYGPLKRTRILKQGDNALSFYEVDRGAS
jgi:16S rRNA (guanine966-N2)-methyltransferase